MYYLPCLLSLLGHQVLQVHQAVQEDQHYQVYHQHLEILSDPEKQSKTFK